VKLYEMAQEGLEIHDLLTDTCGELTPELEERMDALLRGGKDKMEAAAKVSRMLESDARACAEEAKRLSERAASLSKQSKSLKTRMAAVLQAAFGGKIKTALFTIWCQTSADHKRVTLAPGGDLKQLQARRPDLVRTEYVLNETAVLACAGSPDAVLPGEVAVENVPGTLYCRIR